MGGKGWSPKAWALLCRSRAGDSGRSLSLGLPIHAVVIAAMPAQCKGSRRSSVLRFSDHTLGSGSFRGASGALWGTGNGRHSLDADTLHVLGAPGVDVALGILEGLEGVMAPVLLEARMGRGAHALSLVLCPLWPCLRSLLEGWGDGGAVSKGTEEGRRGQWTAPATGMEELLDKGCLSGVMPTEVQSAPGPAPGGGSLKLSGGASASSLSPTPPPSPNTRTLNTGTTSMWEFSKREESLGLVPGQVSTVTTKPGATWRGPRGDVVSAG